LHWQAETPVSNVADMSLPGVSNKLAGKVALVTGGNSGIGLLATAERFAAEGAYVFITGRRKPALTEAVEKIGPKSVMAIEADSSNLADLDRVYSAVRQQKGGLDVVFANAGGGEFLGLEAITEEHYERTFDSNVKGVLFTVQKALPLLREGSSIIINASTAGSMGIPELSVYSGTKAAIRNFIRSWVLELKGRNIRINALSPGPIDTPDLRGLAPTPEAAEALVKSMIETIPLGRMGLPDEVARCVVFLATEESSFVNGSELFVDGGAAQV
jgi:NAD(P)-dependent dehydrogenase (short-subunit alcohol dehydrogenase family)